MLAILLRLVPGFWIATPFTCHVALAVDIHIDGQGHITAEVRLPRQMRSELNVTHKLIESRWPSQLTIDSLSINGGTGHNVSISDPWPAASHERNSAGSGAASLIKQQHDYTDNAKDRTSASCQNRETTGSGAWVYAQCLGDEKITGCNCKTDSTPDCAVTMNDQNMCIAQAAAAGGIEITAQARCCVIPWATRWENLKSTQNSGVYTSTGQDWQMISEMECLSGQIAVGCACRAVKDNELCSEVGLVVNSEKKCIAKPGKDNSDGVYAQARCVELTHAPASWYVSLQSTTADPGELECPDADHEMLSCHCGRRSSTSGCYGGKINAHNRCQCWGQQSDSCVVTAKCANLEIPPECIISDWGEWSACDCADLKKTRQRTVEHEIDNGCTNAPEMQNLTQYEDCVCLQNAEGTGGALGIVAGGNNPNASNASNASNTTGHHNSGGHHEEEGGTDTVTIIIIVVVVVVVLGMGAGAFWYTQNAGKKPAQGGGWEDDYYGGGGYDGY